MALEKKILENPALASTKNSLQKKLALAIGQDAKKDSSGIDYANFGKFTDENIEADYFLRNYENNGLVFLWSDFELKNLDEFGGREIIKSLSENGNIQKIIIGDFKAKLASQIETKANARNSVSGKGAEYLTFINAFGNDVGILKFWDETKNFLETEKTAGNLDESDIDGLKNTKITWREIQNPVLNSLDADTKKLIIQTGAFLRYQDGKEVGSGYIGRLPSAEQKIGTISNTFSLPGIENYLNDSKYDDLKDALKNIPTSDLERYLNNGDIIEVEGKKYIDGIKHKKQILQAIRESNFDSDKKFAFAQAFGLTSQEGYEFLFDKNNSQGEKILDAIFDPDVKDITLDFPGAGSIPLHFGAKNIYFRSKNGSQKGGNLENMALFFDYQLQPLDPQFSNTISDIGVDKKIKFGTHELFSGYQVEAKNETDGKIITGYPRLEMDKNGKEVLSLYETHPLNSPNPKLVGYTKDPNSINILQKNHSLGYEDMMKFLAILAGYKAFEYLPNDEKSSLMQKFRKQNQQSNLENVLGFEDYEKNIEQERLEEKNKKEKDDQISKAQKVLDADPFFTQRTQFGEMMKSKYPNIEQEDGIPKIGEIFLLDASIPSIIDSGNQKLLVKISSIDKKNNIMKVAIFGTENRLGKFEGREIPITMSGNGWSDFLSRPGVEDIKTFSKSAKNIKTHADFENYISQSDVDGWINKETHKNFANKPSKGYFVKAEGDDIKNGDIIHYHLYGTNVVLENVGGGGKHTLSYQDFLAYLSKPFAVWSEEEYRSSGYDPKNSIPGISRPFKFVSLGAGIGAVKSVFKSWQDYNKKRDELGQAELEQMLYYGLKWIPGMGEITSNSGNSKIASMIDDFKKSFDTSAKLDPGPVFDEILKLVQHPKSSHRYKLKVAGAMLYALDKGSLYSKSLVSISGQGLFVRALLGEAHRQSFLNYSQKIRADIALGGPNLDTNRQKLANAEVEYLIQVADNDTSKNFVKLFASDFDEKLKSAMANSQGAKNIDSGYDELKKYGDPADIYTDSLKALKSQNIGTALGGLQALIEKQGSQSGRRYFVQLASQMMFTGAANRFSKAQWEAFDKIANSAGFYFMAGSIKETSNAIDSLEILNALSNIAGIGTTLGEDLGLNKETISKINDKNYISGYEKNLSKINDWFSTNGNKIMTIMDPMNMESVNKIVQTSSADVANKNRIGATMYIKSLTGANTSDKSKSYLGGVVKKNSLGLNSSINHLTKTENEPAKTNFWKSRADDIKKSNTDPNMIKYILQSESNLLKSLASSWEGGIGSHMEEFLKLKKGINPENLNAEQILAKETILKKEIGSTVRYSVGGMGGNFYGENEYWFNGLSPEVTDWIEALVNFLSKSITPSMEEKKFNDIIKVLDIKKIKKDDMTNDEAYRILNPEKYQESQAFRRLYNQGMF